jgi:hypothetical protein
MEQDVFLWRFSDEERRPVMFRISLPTTAAALILTVGLVAPNASAVTPIGSRPTMAAPDANFQLAATKKKAVKKKVVRRSYARPSYGYYGFSYYAPRPSYGCRKVVRHVKYRGGRTARVVRRAC